LTELKTKPVIKHYLDNWRSRVNRKNAGRFLKASFKTSTQGEKISRTPDEQMEGKPQTVTGHKA
jgi:hypothetical protein